MPWSSFLSVDGTNAQSLPIKLTVRVGTDRFFCSQENVFFNMSNSLRDMANETFYAK